jgi:hypothetical protein
MSKRKPKQATSRAPGCPVCEFMRGMVKGFCRLSAAEQRLALEGLEEFCDGVGEFFARGCKVDHGEPRTLSDVSGATLAETMNDAQVMPNRRTSGRMS